MASSTVRIDAESHRLLREMADESGRKMQEILDEAIELYRRQRFLERANESFASLRGDRAAWQDELAERAHWDGALADDLED